MDKIDAAGQLVHDSRAAITNAGQLGKDTQRRHLGQYIQDRKNTGQDYQNRTRGWDIHGRSVGIGHLGQGQSDRTAGAGYP
jgi:hypothetical protein